MYVTFTIDYLRVRVRGTGAAEANFDWSGARGLVACCSMRAELGKHATCACASLVPGLPVICVSRARLRQRSHLVS